MFLKWITRSGAEEYESIYECQRVVVTRHIIDGLKKEWRYDLERDGITESITVLINGEEETHIYVMNNEGKTIDHAIWQPK